MGRGEGKGANDDDKLIFIIPHSVAGVMGRISVLPLRLGACLTTSPLLASHRWAGLLVAIVAGIAYSMASKTNHVYLGFLMAVGLLAFFYNIWGILIDCKDSFSFRRNHMAFLYTDLAIIVLTIPLGIVGAVTWKHYSDNDDDESSAVGANAFNTVVIFVWLLFLAQFVVTLQDNHKAESDPQLLN